MVGGAAVGDAVARARRLPSLRVGLHLVLVDGMPLLAPESIPDLLDAQARLRGDVTRAGVALFLRPRVRRQVGAEIEAQFRAYQATGLALDHVNAHHHFHIHPGVAAQVLDIGRRYGLRAVRVPWEAPRLLADIEPGKRYRRDWVTAPWTALLRRRVRRRGLTAPDRVFGLAWSGSMTEPRIAGILRRLPDGLTEIYAHPATATGFPGAAAGYRYADELAALTAPAIKELLRTLGARSGGFSDFATR
jgi:hopanoid biosynthesis associated protein HpnK